VHPLLAALLVSASLPSASIRTERLDLRFEEAERGPAQALARVAEDDLDALCEPLGGWPGGTPFTIVVASDRAALQRLLGPGVPDWAAGVAFPKADLAGVHLSATGGRGWPGIRRTFRHELAHLLLYRAAGGRRVPRWFNEGFATVQAREWSFSRVRTLTAAALTGRLLPIKALDRRFPARPGEVGLAYAQAVALVSFLIAEDEDAFAQVLAGIRDGRPFPEALATAYGASLPELERRWHEALTRDYRWVPLLTGGTTLWVGITALFLLGYLRRRRRSRATLARWEAEEQAAVGPFERP